MTTVTYALLNLLALQATFADVALGDAEDEKIRHANKEIINANQGE